MIKTIGQMELDELFSSGQAPIFTKAIELKAGTGELKRGQLIGLSTGGTYSAINSNDEPYGVLCHDVTLNASTPVGAVVYVTGHFNANKVIGYNEAQHYNALRSLGIYVEAAIEY